MFFSQILRHSPSWDRLSVPPFCYSDLINFYLTPTIIMAGWFRRLNVMLPFSGDVLPERHCCEGNPWLRDPQMEAVHDGYVRVGQCCLS